MRFEKQVVINAPKDRVWNFFLDARQLASCIPGCENVEPNDSDGYAARIVDKIGPFRVSFQLEVRIKEIKEGRFIRAAATGKDQQLASSFRQTLQAEMNEVAPGQTRVDLSTEIGFLGKIASLGYGLIKRKADGAMAQFSQSVKDRLERA